jgi:hypothetical protein
MGIFSKKFGSSSDIEKQLEDLYVSVIQSKMGMSPLQAKSTFHTLFQRAKEESLKEGTLNLPQNFGDILLEKESTDEKIKLMLVRKRNEGVKDEDIRWWWNMHDLERRMMLKIDELSKIAVYKKLRERDDLSEDEATKRVGKSFPIFGELDDTAQSKGDNKPLPYELKDRINIYVEKRSQTDSEKFKKEIEELSNFNALIRKEIKKGNI